MSVLRCSNQLILLLFRLPETALEVAVATLERQMFKNLQVFPGNLTLMLRLKRGDRGE